MTRREWTWTMAAGLCASLTPACSHLNASRPTEAGAPAVVRQEPPAPPPETRSPYNPLAEATPVAAAPPQRIALDQTPYPASPATRDLVPQPPSLSEVHDVPPVPPETPSAPPAEIVDVKPVEDPPLAAALRCILDKRPADAVFYLEKCDKTSQELLLALLPLVVRISEAGLQHTSPQEAAATLTQLEAVETLFRLRAPLAIKKICFCRNINKFGVYDPLPSDPTFHAGDYIQVYAELQNFSSEWDGVRDCIRVVSKIQIRDFHQNVCWEHTFEDCKADFSQSRRQDFFNHCDFSFPERLPDGPYILWLQVTDIPTGRKAEQTLDFHVLPARGS